MSSEDLYIKNIENAIRALRIGSKEPKDLNVGHNFTKLKPLNEGMHDDLMGKYKTALEVYNKKKK